MFKISGVFTVLRRENILILINQEEVTIVELITGFAKKILSKIVTHVF